MRVTTLLMMVALTAAPAMAWGQGSLNQASRNYYECGSRAFAEAARAFREAHAISHAPALLFNLGRALEASGDAAGALDALTLFRDGGAAGFDRATLDQQIEALRTRVDEERQRPPAPATPTPDAPRPEVVVRERTVIQPAWYQVEYRRSTVSTVVPWVLLGVGGALGVVGAVQGVRALGDIGPLDNANAGREPWSSAAQDALGRASGEATSAYVLLGAGGAMALGGALWLILRGPGERVVSNIAPTLTLAPFGAGVVLGGSADGVGDRGRGRRRQAGR